MYGKKNHSKSINNPANGYTRPNYFGSSKDSAENSYSRISQAVQAMDKSKKKNAKANNTIDTSRHAKSREKELTCNTQILKMRKDLQTLWQLTNSQKNQSEYVPYRKTVQFEKNLEINHSHLANVSPIYTKKNNKKYRNQHNPPNLNDKLDILIKNLEIISEDQIFSPQMSQSILQKKSTLSSKKSVRLDSKSLNSKKHKVKQDLMTNQIDLIKKPSKSIFLMSDLSQESSRFINNFMEGSSRSYQKTERIMPTSRQTRTGPSSIQYYLLQQKLQKQELLTLQLLSSSRPHRSRITTLLSSGSDLISTSLDYTVVKTYQEQSQLMYKHRGGVECAVRVRDYVVSGGRDCYIRGSDGWARRMKANLRQMVTCGEGILVSSSSKVYEFDLERKTQLGEGCDTQTGSFLIEKDQINGCLIGNRHSLALYDRRKDQPQQLFSIKDNIKYWKILKDKVIGVGKYIWMGGLTGLQRVCPFDSQAEVTSICDYYSSYLIGLSEGTVFLFQNDLRVISEITAKPGTTLFGLKNKLACGYPDGTLDLCIIK